MLDNGTQLKNIGMQLQTLGMQINNAGMQLSYMNNNFGIQIQNMGKQISDFSIQIFNIGMQMSNINQIQEPNLNLINNMMNFNEPMDRIEINNNILDNNNYEFYKENIWIVFENPSRSNLVIYVNENETIETLLDRYRKRIGESYEYLDKTLFIYNSIKINEYKKKTIKDYGIITGDKIIVSETFNIIGGPFISFKIIGFGKPLEIGLDKDNLNIYLIKYFNKIGKSNMIKQIKSFPKIDIIDFFDKINDIPNK